MTKNGLLYDSGAFKKNTGGSAYFNDNDKSVYIGKATTSTAMGGDGSTILEVDGSGAASNWCVYNRDCVYGIGTNANQLNVYGKGTAGINFQVSNVSNAMVIDSNGRVGIGTTSPSAPLEISAGNTQSPLTNGLYVYNSTNVANRDAIIAAQVAGSSGGDAYISLDVKNEYGWSIGIDNDDSNKLKISGDYDSLTARHGW